MICKYSDCSGLPSVTIPESVTSIGGGAFSACSGLESLIVDAGNTVYDSRNDCNAIIETASNTLIAGCKNTIIPNSVTSIGFAAFYGCSDLTSVTIPNSVTSIGNFAFQYCHGLTSVTIPESVTSIGTAAFQATTWFENQPDGLVYAGKVAYKYKGTMPAEIVLEEGTVGIAGSAFSGCSGLTSVTIGNSVTEIGVSAFYGCTGLTDVYCYAETVPTTDSDAFYNTSISNVTLHVPAASLDNYAATAPWSGFGTIVPIISSMTLADGGVYTNDTDTDYDEISYTRNFSNTNWQALYVPFEMSYDDWKDDFEVARINNMHQWDDDDDGVIDRTALEIIKVKKGTISANTPYMIKAMTPGEKTITVTDATLYAAAENSIDCSSTSATYTFTGTYSGIPGSEMVSNGYYAMGGGLLRQAAGVENNLSPMRWYLAVTDRDGHPAQFGEVKVMVFGEEETDGVEVIQNSKFKIQNYFDLSGRRTEKPRKGIYIKNGKKYVVQ